MEVRPSEIGLQGRVSNHLERHWLKTGSRGVRLLDSHLTRNPRLFLDVHDNDGPQCGNRTAARGAKLAVATEKRQITGRSLTDVRPEHRRLGELLLPILRIGVRVVARHINRALARWAMRKFKGLRNHKIRGVKWMSSCAATAESLCALA